ncbi:MAG: hypothetical protein J6H31_14555 [Butyrivibrio sp.]|nr:hypothetical protein [Butyrivibrio sp.]
MDKKPIGNILDFMKMMSPIVKIPFLNDRSQADAQKSSSIAQNDFSYFERNENKNSIKSVGEIELRKGADKKLSLQCVNIVSKSG